MSRQPLTAVLAHWDAGGGARAYALDGGATEWELNRISDALLTPDV